jgi:hypothetical protein
MFKKALAAAAIATMASTAMVANAVAQCAPKTVADAGNPCAAANPRAAANPCNPCNPCAATSRGDAYGATQTHFGLRGFPGYGINGGR